MGTEIERKWLIDELNDQLLGESRIIEQYYLCINDTLEVRIRRTRSGGANCNGEINTTLTIKSAGGMKRLEIEHAIDNNDYGEMYNMKIGDAVVKRRYKLKNENNSVEIDVYDGKLDGLIVAEVEFANTECAERYEPPSWFGREVTEDERYKNRMLALCGIPD